MIEGTSININSLIGGDEKAFQVFFVDYYPVLVSFAMKYLENQETAEDIVQDVFVKIWETREKLGGIDNLSAYLYQMVRFKSFIIYVRRKFAKMLRNFLQKNWK